MMLTFRDARVYYYKRCRGVLAAAAPADGQIMRQTLPKPYKIKQNVTPTQRASADVIPHSGHHQQPIGAKYFNSQPISAG